ncbi:hypothetical protein PIB30_019987 [Stylosanthes scabra]|uniref:Uncharacterized protein n=1 Tax=Stylosanthes scabra TaxID=79078 RepID=A0ABU6Z8Q0_9FABA|nr:hypothetical protein [Stylosanthes scabra]
MHDAETLGCVLPTFTTTGILTPINTPYPHRFNISERTILLRLNSVNTLSDLSVGVFCRSRAHEALGKQPSPRKSRPPPRRSPKPHSKPTHYEFMGLVNGHNGRLNRLEQELAQQREVERKLQDELRWRREAKEKIKKLEEGLKQKWVRQEYQYSDLHPGDPFSEEIMKAEVP